MKTKLPASITTLAQAEAFLKELYDNGESFDPLDDARDIWWGKGIFVSASETKRLNKLMKEIFSLPESINMNGTFDPCEYIRSLDKGQTRFFSILLQRL